MGKGNGKGGHGNHGSSEDSDFWTNFTAFFQLVTVFYSTGYAAGELTDVFAIDKGGCEKTGIGLSKVGIGVGGLFGSYAAWGKMQVDRNQNKNNQEGHTLTSAKKTALSGCDTFNFVGQCIAHTNAFSSTVIFLFNLKVSSPTFFLKLGIQSLALLIGATATVSDVRAGKRNLLGGRDAKDKSQPDCLNNWTSVVDGASEFINGLSWAADCIDTIVGSYFEENFSTLGVLSLGFPWPIFIMGGVIGLLSIGGTLCHRNVAIHDDGAGNKLPPDVKGSLKNKQVGLLCGDFIAHMTEIATPFQLVYHLVTGNKMTPGWTQFGATFFGAVSAYSGVRTCRQVMWKQNYEAEKKAEEEAAETACRALPAWT